MENFIHHYQYSPSLTLVLCKNVKFFVSSRFKPYFQHQLGDTYCNSLDSTVGAR